MSICSPLKPEALTFKGHEVSGDIELKALLCTVGHWPEESQSEGYLKRKKEGISGGPVSGRLHHVIKYRVCYHLSSSHTELPYCDLHCPLHLRPIVV